MKFHGVVFFMKILKKIFSPKQKFNSEQLLFWMHSHISTQKTIFNFLSILAIFGHFHKRMLLVLRFWLGFLPYISWCCVSYEHFQKNFFSPKQKFNSEQLLFWMSSHISTSNMIFSQF